MAHNQRSLFWFRRDFRLEDNCGLEHALKESDELLCVFVFDSNILNKLKDKNDKRVSFIWQSVLKLQEHLQQLGSELFILHGNPIELIPAFAEHCNVDAVYLNRDYEGYALHRDDEVQALLNKQEKKLHSYKDHIIFEGNEVLKPNKKPYSVFTPYKKAWLNKLISNFSELSKAKSVELLEEKNLNKDLPSKNTLEEIRRNLENEGIRIVQSLEDIGFEAVDFGITEPYLNGKKKLQEFISQRIVNYNKERDFPALDSTSHLSVHLRFGTISIRECARRAFKLLESYKDGSKESENINTWISELVWRDFYSMVLQCYPIVEEQSFKPEYRNINWSINEATFEKWANGQTGYPIVDAGMRELKQTGFMHNRVRMIVASFLTKHLLIDWKLGEKHFARYLMDYDLASNNGGWQWAASVGTDAVPYFRVFNPQLQGERFDKEAKYIKKFVPEVSSISAKDIHALSFSVDNYPAPIVKHKEAREKVLSLFKLLKEKTS